MQLIKSHHSYFDLYWCLLEGSKTDNNKSKRLPLFFFFPFLLSGGWVAKSVVILINKVKDLTQNSKLGKGTDKEQANSVIRTWNKDQTQGDLHGK